MVQKVETQDQVIHSVTMLLMDDVIVKINCPPFCWVPPATPATTEFGSPDPIWRITWVDEDQRVSDLSVCLLNVELHLCCYNINTTIFVSIIGYPSTNTQAYRPTDLVDKRSCVQNKTVHRNALVQYTTILII